MEKDMKHLDINAAVDLADGGKHPLLESHVEDCGRCRRLVASVSSTLLALTGATESLAEPPLGLQRWARAYARVATATRPRLRVLGFLAGGANPLAAVRGSLEHSQAILYGDERTHIDLRVEAGVDGSVRLHGQVVPVGEKEHKRWKLSVVSPDGNFHTTTTDGDGEFWIDGLSSSYGWTLMAESEDLRLLVPRFGGENGGFDEP